MQGEHATDTDGESFRIVSRNRRGRVDVARTLGTIRGGGPLASVGVRVFMSDGTRIQRYEVSDVGDADPARARFAELRRVDGASP